jgi:hypothetical protein
MLDAITSVIETLQTVAEEPGLQSRRIKLLGATFVTGTPGGY